MIKPNAFVIILVAGLFLNSCMDFEEWRELNVYNKSRDTIYSILSENDTMGSSSYYVEFKTHENEIYSDSLNRFIFSEIEPKAKVGNHDSPRKWETYFDRIPDKKLRLFIVSKDSVKKYGWHKIFKNQVYDKKYKLSLENLKESKWEVVYE